VAFAASQCSSKKILSLLCHLLMNYVTLAELAVEYTTAAALWHHFNHLCVDCVCTVAVAITHG